jgi:CRISPR-associated protein Cas2
MERRRSLVAYDIADPKRLRLVHKKVLGYGDAMQYSVFVCDLTSAERADLLNDLIEIIDPSVDRIAIIDLGDQRVANALKFLGRPPLLPSSGTTVV